MLSKQNVIIPRKLPSPKKFWLYAPENTSIYLMQKHHIKLLNFNYPGTLVPR